MADKTEYKQLSAASAVVRNPLSVIALFVLLVEAIATITLVKVVAQQEIAVPLVWFIVIFPALIAVLFFTTLWWRHECLYSPMEYRSDKSFLTAIQRLKRVEALQDAAKINPHTADIEDSITVIDRLLDLSDVRAAVKVGRTFLEAEQYETAVKVYEHILKKTPKNHEARYNVFANLGYAQTGLHQYKESIDSLEQCIRLKGEKNAHVWHHFAMAYNHFKLSKNTSDAHYREFKKRLAKGKKDIKYRGQRKFYAANLYPDMAKHL